MTRNELYLELKEIFGFRPGSDEDIGKTLDLLETKGMMDNNLSSQPEQRQIDYELQQYQQEISRLDEKNVDNHQIITELQGDTAQIRKHIKEIMDRVAVLEQHYSITWTDEEIQHISKLENRLMALEERQAGEYEQRYYDIQLKLVEMDHDIGKSEEAIKDIFKQLIALEQHRQVGDNEGNTNDSAICDTICTALDDQNSVIYKTIAGFVYDIICEFKSNNLLMDELKNYKIEAIGAINASIREKDGTLRTHIKQICKDEYVDLQKQVDNLQQLLLKYQKKDAFNKQRSDNLRGLDLDDIDINKAIEIVNWYIVHREGLTSLDLARNIIFALNCE